MLLGGVEIWAAKPPKSQPPHLITNNFFVHLAFNEPLIFRLTYAIYPRLLGPAEGVPQTGLESEFMNAFRAFIAIDLTEEVQQTLEQVKQRLKNIMGEVPVRWVPVSNIHLTLKFLGNVSHTNYEMLTEILQSETSAHSVFAIGIGRIGAYPNIRRPRVIWVGVEAPPELDSLQRAIEVEATRLGYSAERRAFSPHLTLGRVARNSPPDVVRTISGALRNNEVGFLGVVQVRAIHLYRSDLKPGGAVYTRMFSAPLKEG